MHAIYKSNVLWVLLILDELIRLLNNTLKSWHIIKNSNKMKWKQIKRMTGVYVRFVLTSLTEHQSARSEHICQCLRKIMKVLVWIVWQCVPGRLIDNFTLLVTRPGTPLHMWNIELKILDFQHFCLQFTIQYEWISQLRNEIEQQGKMFIYSGGFWYLYQD